VNDRTEEDAAGQPFDEFTGTILTATFSQSAAASNAVMEAQQDRIDEMGRHFCDLYRQLRSANVRVDSATIANLLEDWEWLYVSIRDRKSVA
jgi:hypothetical protein